MTKRVLLSALGVLVALAGLAAFLVLQGLDEADKWSSVLSLFFTVAGFALALAGFVTRGPAQSADHAVTGGSLHQVRNVAGDVVITPGGGGTGTPPTAAPAEGQGGGTQSAHGARTAGDLHQIDGVGGAVRIEPPTPDSAS
ncbi:hypothetical protein [Streptomyces sp. WAC01280]|uniref:hypothetical protein n=1 Tax=Streptomyces sp. WAC01280 TaxID=2487424 RepID=UPI000F7B6EBE|nr:hypothetical protein [Streptomyces sp. WAC01280]RSS52655.1 hypothetical protein EF909_30355 [Streptomyces sp. WAC01280]